VIEAIAGMAAFAIVWSSYGYSLSELQNITPKLLAQTANRRELLIYAQATTLTLVAIVACQDGNVFACRSERASIFQLGFFSNPFIWIGLGVEWIIIAMFMRLRMTTEPIFHSWLGERVISTLPIPQSFNAQP
jgi:magnesium-transporting ATPase (P-type)